MSYFLQEDRESILYLAAAGPIDMAGALVCGCMGCGSGVGCGCGWEGVLDWEFPPGVHGGREGAGKEGSDCLCGRRAKEVPSRSFGSESSNCNPD